MYSSKVKGTHPPSDAMAREKLMVHVYEYLKHSGAPQAAETFLKEVRFDKQLNYNNEPPGFLFSWWSVFWDLYSSAPERRNLNPHSEEAKAFHDYNFINGQPNNNGQMYMNGMQHNSNAPSPLGGMPPNVPNDAMGPAGNNPAFFNSHMRPSPTQPVNQPSPHTQMLQNQQFMSPRYPVVPGPRGPNVRMPQDFNQPGQPPMMGPGNMDHPNRQGDGDFVSWQGPNMQPNNPRMPTGPHPTRGVPMGVPGNMGQPFPSMRPPNGQPQPNNGQMPINMPGGPNNGPPPGRQWANQMNYNSPSPGNHYGPPVSQSGPAPGTPGAPGIMPSPQGSAPYSPASHRMGTPNTGRDSSGPGDGMYPMMKNVSNFVMNEPPNLQHPTSSPCPTDSILESIKQSPSHPPDQPNPDHNIDYNNIVPYPENDQNESAAIMKIKESMQEEAKRFEKEPDLIEGPYYQ